MSNAAPHKSPRHHGPLDWRRMVDWLQADGVIAPEEAQRTIARCSQAESSQPPLVRLANVAMARASDGKPLDLDALTEYLARRSGLAYLRIDPLKVDVGRVADVMSASYAERHKVLPVQVGAHEVVIATAEPFVDDWVAEVERQAKRSVRRVVANPQDIHRYTAEFFALAKAVRAASKAGGSASSATRTDSAYGVRGSRWMTDDPSAASTRATESSTDPVSTATIRSGRRVEVRSPSITAGSQRAPLWLTRRAVTFTRRQPRGSFQVQPPRAATAVTGLTWVRRPSSSACAARARRDRPRCRSARRS